MDILKNKQLREKTHIKDDKNRLAKYFIWKSESLDIPRNIELLLRRNGSIGYDLIHNKWVEGTFSGEVDDLNEPVLYICHTLATSKKTYELRNGIEVIVCRNNALATSDYDNILYNANLRTENDISTYFQLVNSRNIPVLVANNDQVKKEIERVFDNIEAGKPVVVTTDMLSQVEVLDITDKSAIEKLQCLTSFDEVLLKREMNLFGATLDVKDKKAQVNSMELQAFDDYTTLSFLANYEERKDFCEKMKEAGYTIECIRNPIFSDEPTDEDIEEGTRNSEEEIENEESNTTNSLSESENEQQASNDPE